MEKFILNLPLKIFLGHKRKKKANGEKVDKHFYINLNQYRNADFFTLNKAKALFKEMVQDQINQLPAFEWVTMKYILFPGSYREMDTNNVCSIAEKFFSDALVESGKLEDDNYQFLKETTFSFGEVNPQNPRVELHLSGPRKEEKMDMQVNLTNEDFMEAMHSYVKAKLPMIPAGVVPDIAITAGRGEKGYTAVVTFDLNAKAAAPTGPVKRSADPMQESLKEQGNVMNRLGEDMMPKAQPVTSDAPKELAEAVTNVITDGPEGQTDTGIDEPANQFEVVVAALAEPEKKADSGSLFAPKVDDVKSEKAAEIGGAKEEPKKSKPLFEFGS